MPARHVVVDGSNIATEGRSLPSLGQLDQAVREFVIENPNDVVTVVVDATFGHRIAPEERERFEQAESGGEIVSPPAGAIGRGDAFLLRVADKVGAVVLSNDSFQEFHGEYEWLFDRGRLIGGKPVPGVGWIFTPRTPVRGPKSRESVKEAKRKRHAERPEEAKESGLDMAAESHVHGGERKLQRAIAAAVEEAVEPAKGGRKRRRRRRGAEGLSEPLNEPLKFITFIAGNQLGDEVEGTVEEFSSHGAFVSVDGARCYLPLSAMGDVPPRSAREVLRKGEKRAFVVQAFDALRRGIEVAMPGFARLAGTPTEETIDAEIHRGDVGDEAVAAVPDAARVPANGRARQPAPSLLPVAPAAAPVAPSVDAKPVRRATSKPRTPTGAAKEGAPRKAVVTKQAPVPAIASAPPKQATPRATAGQRKVPVKEVASKAAGVATTSERGSASTPSGSSVTRVMATATAGGGQDAVKRAPAKRATARKAIAEDLTTKEVAAKEIPANKVPANKVPANKVPANKVPANKVPANKVPANKVPADDVPAKKITAPKVTGQKVTGQKATGQKVTAKKAPAKKAPAGTVPSKKAPTRKAPAKSLIVAKAAPGDQPAAASDGLVATRSTATKAVATRLPAGVTASTAGAATAKRSAMREPAKEPSVKEPSTKEPSTKEPSTKEPSTKEPAVRRKAAAPRSPTAKKSPVS
jgi:Zc3h12a-like Ribonuclease NYN domain/S1 RNA binding domain